MVDLWTPGHLGSVIVKNRLVRSAVWEALGDADGFVTEALVSYTRELAEGGVGLIVLGYTYVTPDGRQHLGQTGLFSDDHIPGMRRITAAVHAAGGKISIQLVHAGPQIKAETKKTVIRLAPSAVPHPGFGTPNAMTQDDIERVVEAFGQAARRADAAGFDAIQIHGAHGYLVSQFLSPLWNRRDDAYGGSLEHRMRFAVEVYRAVRRAAGTRPVWIKLNLDDFIPGSTTSQDALPLGEKLSDLGIDAIEVSAGGPISGKGPARTKIDAPEKEGYFLELARQTKARVTCPVMVTGGFRSPEVIERALSSGAIDFATLARPLIREPHLIRRWQSGDLSPAKCISCNGCFKTIPAGKGVRCFVELTEKKKGAQER